MKTTVLSRILLLGVALLTSACSSFSMKMQRVESTVGGRSYMIVSPKFGSDRLAQCEDSTADSQGKCTLLTLKGLGKWDNGIRWVKDLTANDEAKYGAFNTVIRQVNQLAKLVEATSQGNFESTKRVLLQVARVLLDQKTLPKDKDTYIGFARQKQADLARDLSQLDINKLEQAAAMAKRALVDAKEDRILPAQTEASKAEFALSQAQTSKARIDSEMKIYSELQALLEDKKPNAAEALQALTAVPYSVTAPKVGDSTETIYNPAQSFNYDDGFRPVFELFTTNGNLYVCTIKTSLPEAECVLKPWDNYNQGAFASRYGFAVGEKSPTPPVTPAKK